MPLSLNGTLAPGLTSPTHGASAHASASAHLMALMAAALWMALTFTRFQTGFESNLEQGPTWGAATQGEDDTNMNESDTKGGAIEPKKSKNRLDDLRFVNPKPSAGFR